MIMILGGSTVAAIASTFLLEGFENEGLKNKMINGGSTTSDGENELGGAATRELQRKGLWRLWISRKREFGYQIPEH